MIKREEWLEELRKISSQQPDGFSVEDLVKEQESTKHIVYPKLKEAIDGGLVEFAGYRDELGITGRKKKVPVYRFIEDEVA